MNVTDTFLYVIAAKKNGVFVPPVKVGISLNPKARLDSLQTASPDELGLVGVLIYPSREIALEMEDCFHGTHVKHHVRGEWFDIEPRQALTIARLQLAFALDMFTSFSEEEQQTCIAVAESHLP